MGVFGRITMLVDENTYAVNFFIQALLQLLDRSAAFSPSLVFPCRRSCVRQWTAV